MGFGDLTGGQGLQYSSGIEPLRMEAGCWTKSTTTSICIPTTLTTLVSFVMCVSAAFVNSADPTSLLVLGGYIQCPTTAASLSGISLQYIATGW